jgi:hypothetical protein
MSDKVNIAPAREDWRGGAWGEIALRQRSRCPAAPAWRRQPHGLVPLRTRVYDRRLVDVWTFIWLMVLLKIPIVALFLLVRWAVRQEPDTGVGGDGGIGPRLQPRHPHHPRPRPPRLPRRGPHGEPPLPSPPRVRALVARRRMPHR